jgi:osmoprotectant transport system substrate-binding protein
MMRTRPMMPIRRLRGILLATAVALAVSGCGQATPKASRDQSTLRIASYDFAENQVLAELYAQTLRHKGLRVEIITGLGPREIVEPALEQGQVDLVVDYLGTALDFLSPGDSRTHGSSDSVYAALREKLASHAITALPYAAAQDQNGFAVTKELATSRSLTKLTDLTAIAGALTFGGPPECPSRRYCLAGLTVTYGLHFKAVRSVPTRAATATALMSGEVDVGLLETTDPRLADGQLRLLVDDKQLQPRENVVPLVRDEVSRRYGDRLIGAVQEVTSLLSTETLISLNRSVQINGQTSAQAAAAWLASAAPASSP